MDQKLNTDQKDNRFDNPQNTQFGQIQFKLTLRRSHWPSRFPPVSKRVIFPTPCATTDHACMQYSLD